MAGLVYKWRNGWKSQDSRTFFLRLRNVGAACLVLWAFVYSLGMTTSNPLSLGILPAAFLCIQYEERRLHVDTREKRILLFLGTFFAVASVLAQPERWSQSVGLLLTLSGLGIFYYYVLKGLYCWQRGRLFFHGERKSGSNRIWKIAGLGILLCWLPFYLSAWS